MNANRTILLSSYLTRRQGENLPPLRSLALPDGRPGPARRLVALYGTRATMEGQRESIEHARSEGLAQHRVEIRVPVHCTNEKINHERLPEQQFVLLSWVLKDLSEWTCKQLGLSGRSHIDAVVAHHPERLNDLWAMPEFSHVKVFAWESLVPEKGTRRMAAVRAAEDIGEIVLDGTTEVPEVIFEGSVARSITPGLVTMTLDEIDALRQEYGIIRSERRVLYERLTRLTRRAMELEKLLMNADVDAAFAFIFGGNMPIGED